MVYTIGVYHWYITRWLEKYDKKRNKKNRAKKFL